MPALLSSVEYISNTVHSFFEQSHAVMSWRRRRFWRFLLADVRILPAKDSVKVIIVLLSSLKRDRQREMNPTLGYSDITLQRHLPPNLTLRAWMQCCAQESQGTREKIAIRASHIIPLHKLLTRWNEGTTRHYLHLPPTWREPLDALTIDEALFAPKDQSSSFFSSIQQECYYKEELSLQQCVLSTRAG